jgi:thiol-disulfide isomerase/thioredoxin
MDIIMNLIRVWKEIDISQIENKIVIVDDLHGFCPACKKTGIPYEQLNKCPGCGTEFIYITIRENPKTPSGNKIIAKILKNQPNLIIVDYSDYKHLSDKKKAHSLFS